MQITPFFLVLAAIIGLLIGLLVANLFNPRDTKAANEGKQPEFLGKEGYSEIAHIWHSPAGNKIITELDGDYYREFLTLSPEQKRKITKIIELWSAWAGAQPKPLPQPQETMPVMKAPQVTQPMQSISDQVTVPIQVKEEPEPEKAAAKPTTIAGQISQIIEKMLENHPLREKGIKLIENANHGVDVWIGMEKFDGIDAIPYPEAQRLIRDAVAEWEKQSELEHKIPSQL